MKMTKDNPKADFKQAARGPAWMKYSSEYPGLGEPKGPEGPILVALKASFSSVRDEAVKLGCYVRETAKKWTGRQP
jgi:hypothetical protein